MDTLISDLEKGIKNNSPYIITIRKPKMLVKALKELNIMIGNDKIKEKVALQVTHLIAQRLKPACDQKPIMLHSIIYGLPGVGKCLAKNTPVIMYDGSSKMVQDINKDELLMGDDSTPRKVLSTVTGREQMYTIQQQYGDNYTVNASHILSLKLTKNPRVIDIINKYKYKVIWYDKHSKNSLCFAYNKNTKPDITLAIDEFVKLLPKCGDIIDIKVTDYINKSNSWKNAYLGFKVPVNYKNTFVKLNPYSLGFFISSEYGTYASANDFKIKKYIPIDYLYNSRNVRLQLLAGIIDGSGVCYDDFIEILSEDDTISNDIIKLCRSLGLKAECDSYITTLKEDDIINYVHGCKITISGDLYVIPSKRYIFNTLAPPLEFLTYKINVVKTYVDDYYGFIIDGNHRFLLGDFTVTHNTSIGVHLAKIWYALGYINGGKNVKNNESSDWGDIKNKLGDIMGEGGSGDGINEQMMMFIYIIGIILLTVFSYIWSGAKWCYSTLGAKWFFIALGMILLFILIVLTINYMTTPTSNSDGRNSQCIDGDCTNNKEQNKNNINYKNKKLDDDEVSTEDIITITSREDFIAEYVGWTDKKTKKLLRDNMGKVVFIDEAYSLNSGYHDSFGKEAIDTLNRFMSENPDGIVIIMAGYKDKLQNNLFKVQPGLKRRFMWQFECKGYEIDELFEIWLQQIEPWKVQHKVESREVFRMYKWAFPNFAGDTLRLTNYAQIEHSRDIIAGNKPNENILSTKHVLKGIQTLIDNNMETGDAKGECIDESSITEILETIYNMHTDKSKNRTSDDKDEMTITEID